MNKSLLIIIVIGLVGIVVLVFGFLGKGGKMTQPSTRIIKGIGFKEGAWGEYEVRTKKKEEKQFGPGYKMTFKIFGFDIGGKKIKGIETSFIANSVVFWDETGKSYQGLFMPGIGLICEGSQAVFGTSTLGVGGFKKENLEEEYKVDESLEFVGKGKFKTQSGKELEILKYKSKTENREFWFSPQVPTYLVYAREGSGEIEGEIMLLDFGLEGAKISISQKDLERCLRGESTPQIPIPQIPPLLQPLQSP
jgi:hypothetical protein